MCTFDIQLLFFRSLALIYIPLARNHLWQTIWRQKGHCGPHHHLGLHGRADEKRRRKQCARPLDWGNEQYQVFTWKPWKVELRTCKMHGSSIVVAVVVVEVAMVVVVVVVVVVLLLMLLLLLLLHVLRR